MHGKSKKDRVSHGGGGGDKKGRKDHSREKKRDRSGERSKRNAERDSNPEPTTSHAPHGSARSSRSTPPKPPKKVNLAHSVIDNRRGDRRRPRDGYSDESSSDQESHRGYHSSDDDGRRSRKRSRDVRHINVTKVPRPLETSDPRTYEDISDGALLIPAPAPRTPRVIPIRKEAPTVPPSLERASTTEGPTVSVADMLPGP